MKRAQKGQFDKSPQKSIIYVYQAGSKVQNPKEATTMIEIQTEAGKFTIEKVDVLPEGLGSKPLSKWDFLREAMGKGLKSQGDKIKLNCPNKKQAMLAQSAAKNYPKRGKGRLLPKDCLLRTNTLPLKNGTVDVYIYFEE